MSFYGDGAEALTEIVSVKEQIDRYMKAVYGPSYGFRAPETFENLVERWMLYVAGGSIYMANSTMEIIENMAKERGR